MRHFFRTERLRRAGLAVVVARLLDERATAFNDRDLPLDLVVDAVTNEGNGVEILQLDLGAEVRGADGANRDIGVTAQLPLLHVAVGDAAVNHRRANRREIRVGLFGRVHRRIGDDLHERGAGTIVVDERIGRTVVQFADVFLEVDAGERNFFVLSHKVAGGSGEFDFDRATEADGLVVLGDLIVLRGVGIKIVFAVPLADRRDLAAEQEAGLDDGVERGLVHDRQRTGERKDDGIGERVGFVPVAGGNARKHLGLSLDLDVDFQTDDGFVVHFFRGRGPRNTRHTRKKYR